MLLCRLMRNMKIRVIIFTAWCRSKVESLRDIERDSTLVHSLGCSFVMQGMQFLWHFWRAAVENLAAVLRYDRSNHSSRAPLIEDALLAEAKRNNESDYSHSNGIVDC